MGYKQSQVRSLTRDSGSHQAWPVKKSAGPGRLNEREPDPFAETSDVSTMQARCRPETIGRTRPSGSTVSESR